MRNDNKTIIENSLPPLNKHQKQSTRIHKELHLDILGDAYEIDRDRIIHSTSFRRLKNKTQVFFYTKNDHIRTRLTHSIAVASIAQTLAHALNLNPTLSETIALGHDLGHPPFGHFGETILSNLYGEKFDHNMQTLRLVMELEHIRPEYSGLNLTYNTLYGLLQHHDPINKNVARWVKNNGLNPNYPILFESIITSLCDDIAYLSHDVEDALESHILSLDQLEYENSFLREIIYEINKEFNKDMEFSIKIAMISSRIRATLMKNIMISSEDSPNFSSSMENIIHSLKEYLKEQFYNAKILYHEKIQAQKIIEKLWKYYNTDKGYLKISKKFSNENKKRNILDYIAEMSDQYATMKYKDIQ